MARKKKQKRIKRPVAKKSSLFSLPEKAKRLILGVIMFLFATIISLSFFDLAGIAGKNFIKISNLLIGRTIFILPLLFLLSGLILFRNIKIKEEKIKSQARLIFLSIFILILGISGILSTLALNDNKEAIKEGGWLGYLSSMPLFKFFGFLATEIIFLSLVVIGSLIVFYLFSEGESSKKTSEEKEEKKEKPTLIKKIFGPKFKVKEISSNEENIPVLEKKPEKSIDIFSKTKTHTPALIQKGYSPPPIDLLKKDGDVPDVGDIKINSAIIKKTLQDFDIPVEMSEVNIGPTVTQYTLKPAEGIKLSKITGLSNDLSLALAASSIRIEAPIPGRSLVGIEVPNKTRAQVRLRNIIENPSFYDSSSNLTIALGKDVSGSPVFADLAKMPHLLVAGSTGSGKTIALNNIILSLVYKNGPDALRFILIDPKRVEFPVYNNLPHLLCPIIYDPQRTISALKWLILEMERRFEVLSLKKSRNIFTYNEKILKEDSDPMPYIVLIIDELADLMAAKGREIEAGIVRLAQMARAVGIHLVVATQRPSVEVITGLIKANITSRIALQVVSQIDSRTILDAAGAEKLLGQGDMLFISSSMTKPKRIQTAYVSEKEVKKVADYIKSEIELPKLEPLTQEELEGSSETNLEKGSYESSGEEDPLYEEAKKIVIEARKASSSLLQRRLRIGYARAARLIDILEERSVVGPADGAKPREVYIQPEQNDGEWKEV